MSAIQTAAEAISYKSLREKQLEVLVNFLSGNGVLAVLHTGYRKRLCYTCLPKTCDVICLTEGSIVAVASPLTAIYNLILHYIVAFSFIHT